MATAKQLKKKSAQLDRRHRRVRARVSGTTERPRLNVFRSLTNIYAQVIDDHQRATRWRRHRRLTTTLPRRLTARTRSKRRRSSGRCVAERAKAAGISAVVFDRGGYQYHGRVAALAEGAREGGLNF